MTAPTYPRTHDRLSRDITPDPIFLLQRKDAIWYPCDCSDAKYDYEAERFKDANGRDLTTSEAIDAGAGVWTWTTITVFLTREEGEDWANARSYRYPHGWRVYCVPAEGAMRDVLAGATEGGRYL